MGQIVSIAAKPKRCNANQLSQVPTPAAGEYILVSSDNSMNAAGQGNFDSYIVGVGTTAATELPLHNIEEALDIIGRDAAYTPTYTVTSGSYIDKDGVLSSNASFKKTSAFHVQKGGVVTFVGRANATMACIAKTNANETSYQALVIGQSNSVEHTYTYTATEDCYIVVSYYDVVSITATTVNLFTQLQDKVSSIEEDVAELGGDVQEVQETIGKDETYTPTYEVVNGSYVDSAGIVQSNASFKKTSAIKVAANSKVTFVGKANPTMACIAKTDANESSYEVLKLGVSNTADNTYTAEVAEGCYIVISYYALTTLSIESKSAFSSLNDRIDSVEEGMESLPDVEAKVDSVVIDSYYNIDSEYNNISFDNIVLSRNGDSFEVEVEPNVDNEARAYAFTQSRSLSGIGLSISRSNIYVRLDNGTWAFSILGENPASGKFKVKVAYENDVMNLYIDNVLKDTYNGQSTLTLMRIGFVYNVQYFWLGKLYSAAYTHNGISTPLEKLQGFTLNDLSKTYEKEYTQAIEEITLSKIHIVPTANAVGVYFRIKDDLYGGLTIGHEVNTGTDETSESARNPNTDYWRLTGQGGIFKREGNTFTSQLKKLLVGAENEFAIAFAGMNTYAGSGDFTGGYHGNERIDLDSSCYVTFIVNGEEYTISELIALGDIDCETFAYRELSELYTSYNYENLHTHTAFAKHLKVTEFGNFGYKTRNFVKLNLSGIGKSFLTINTAFTGLVCIHKDFAHKIIGDDGSVYYGQNPTTTTTLVPVLDYYTREMVASNGIYSCFIDSHYLGSDVDVFENPPIDVRVMDRANDNKYYSYLPYYAQANDGEFFATECEVKWFVN